MSSRHHKHSSINIKNNLGANQITYTGEAVNTDELYQHPGSAMVKKPMSPGGFLEVPQVFSPLECLFLPRAGCLTGPHQGQLIAIHNQ